MNNLSIRELEKYSKEFYVFSGFEKISFIKKYKGKWQVVSKKGKPLGTYDTKEDAEKRLRQIEFFKHKKASENKSNINYSSIVRMLNKQYDENTVNEFKKLFKLNFDDLYLSGNDEPEEEALELTLSSIKNFHKKANAIEMGEANFAGKRLSDLVHFLLRRIPEDKRGNAIKSIRKKIYMINEYDVSGKKTPPSSSIGNSISIIKTILLEHQPEYIRNVLNEIVRNL